MVFKPVVSRDLRVVLIDFAVPLFPVEVLALADSNPANDSVGGNFRFMFPVTDVVDDFVADVMGNPPAR